MNDLIQEIIDIKKDLATLSEQVHGAAFMVNELSPQHEFFMYIQRVLLAMHDKLAIHLKLSKEKSPPLNCS